MEQKDPRMTERDSQMKAASSRLAGWIFFIFKQRPKVILGLFFGKAVEIGSLKWLRTPARDPVGSK